MPVDGRFRFLSPLVEEVGQVVMSVGVIRVDRQDLFQGGDRFASPAGRVTFVREGNRVTGLTLFSRGVRDLLLTGRIITAPEAYHFGLINEVVPPDQLMSRAHELAAQLIENSPASLAATKKLLNNFSVDDLNAEIKAAVDANAGIRATDDFREGVTSFLEKRKPVWKS